MVRSTGDPAVLAEWYERRAVTIDGEGGSLDDACRMLHNGLMCVSGDVASQNRLSEALKQAARLRVLVYSMGVGGSTSLGGWLASPDVHRCSVMMKGLTPSSARAIFKTRLLPLMS